MSFSGQIYPDDTVGYFRIASSTGRQPIEPIGIGQFRIGSAEHCQLRLGDSEIADVHTVLTVERNRVLLHCKTDFPQVVINGTPASECELEDGDLVEIGDYRLLFRKVGAEQRITLDETAFGDDIGAATTEELIHRLEEQIELVEELAAPDEAIMNLLNAAAHSATNTRSLHSVAPAQLSELAQVRALLLKHHEASRIRLESLTEVLDNVVKQQKLIADTLEVMSTRIQAFEATGFQQRRASA